MGEQVSKILLLLPESGKLEEIKKNFKNVDIIELDRENNYYRNVFTILQNLLPNQDLNKYRLEFEEQNNAKKIRSQPNSEQENLKNTTLEQKKSYSELGNLFWKPLTKQNKAMLLILVLVSSVVGGYLTFSYNEKGNNVASEYDSVYASKNKGQDNSISHLIRSDLSIPNSSIFLNRSELMNQIDQNFNKQGDIQTLALIGIGGSGKTTIARQYARKKENIIKSVVWEINAETKEELIESYEKLAFLLAKTEEDRKFLKGIVEIKKLEAREEELLQFVKKHLRINPNWLLIYDNVENFTEIQKYFPNDPNIWGSGEVILTTRDANISNNKHVNYTIFVGELNPKQKLELFKNIMSKESDPPFTPAQLADATHFLENIPPFPLDVSVAGYYLKATGIQYVDYIDKLNKFSNEFASLQENILKEVGEYSKTRSSILILSLQSVLKAHKDFADFLLCISMIDSQSIPRNILNNFKNTVVVDNFIFNLKKYSLITTEFSNSSFAIHRSTQRIILSYITNIFNAEKKAALIKAISENLEKCINETITKEDIDEMKPFVNHCVAFLNHTYLLNPDVKGSIQGQLGIIYYFLGDNIQAKDLLMTSLSNLKKDSDENLTRIPLFLGYLGNVQRDLGDYKDAKRLLERSISIYEKSYPKEAQRYGYFLVHLGCVERILGNYEQARILFEKGSLIQQKYFPENDNYAAWVSGHLGIIEREMGEYDKAKINLERSLAIFKRDRSLNHFDTAWALGHLTEVYVQLGDYEKAKETSKECLKILASFLPDKIGPAWILAYFESIPDSEIEKEVKNLFNQLQAIYKIHFHDSYIYVAWAMKPLANTYMKTGNYERAKFLLGQILSIFQKNYGTEHIATAQIFSDLGQVFLLGGNLEAAEPMLIKAFGVLKLNKHPASYVCLEKLSDLLLKKSLLANDLGNVNEARNFKTQSSAYLKQAHEIVKDHFPPNSPHIIRVQSKLKSLISQGS
jgi:tetratricopeptide (TPR) repeat protein